MVLPATYEGWMHLFSSNPTFFVLQLSMFTAAIFLIFLILFTTRDVLLRSHSFLFQIFSIALVALFPLAGFLLYLLIRPSRTNREKFLERKLTTLVHDVHQLQTSMQSLKKGGNKHHNSVTFKMQGKAKEPR